MDEEPRPDLFILLLTFSLNVEIIVYLAVFAAVCSSVFIHQFKFVFLFFSINVLVVFKPVPRLRTGHGKAVLPECHSSYKQSVSLLPSQEPKLII